jgi:triosephosphate isomerase
MPRKKKPTALRVPLVVGNWKMFTTKEEAVKLAKDIERWIIGLHPVDTVIAPPTPWIVTIVDSFKGKPLLKLAAQNAMAGLAGAETGSVSIGMLAPYIQYLIVGHSERRTSKRDDFASINEKVKDALKRGLTPILCVGEFVPIYQAKRKRGRPTKDQAASNIFMQLRKAIAGVKKADMARIVIAYEPVWAIGSGNAATPDYASKMIKSLRRSVARQSDKATATKVRILYGGSVTGSNAKSFAKAPGVDGVLVGGASLNAESFVAIVNAFATQH